MCVPSPYTGAVVLGFLEPENKIFIDDEVRALLGMVACWLPAAPQPEGGCPSVLMSCALFLFLTKEKKKGFTLFAVIFLCDGIGRLQ